MVQYYWNPGYANPGYAQQQITPPPPSAPGGRPGTPPFREESYIENILRLNRGKPGVFHFSFERAMETGTNTKAVTGMVEAAGRDHVILSEAKTGRRYLFPMIYFDYAEFPEEINYFNQST
ncbi:spore coat protein GerQ [Sporosarcina sp. P37]|uniref:spore coat protein GerQ n=1 Tax=unclassified Sporosarcina TaxID=2647733 RepID=UPI000A17D06A|nr:MULTISPECIES: spore coat protein GerQ [unclassified Sporosarcina]ARK25240.1 spore coat protein GerQ [Sporosarcina sp. P37]PID17151.1 spore coat protein GerQ [Sporosarcina sp. P35]